MQYYQQEFAKLKQLIQNMQNSNKWFPFAFFFLNANGKIMIKNFFFSILFFFVRNLSKTLNICLFYGMNYKVLQCCTHNENNQLKKKKVKIKHEINPRIIYIEF